MRIFQLPPKCLQLLFSLAFIAYCNSTGDDQYMCDLAGALGAFNFLEGWLCDDSTGVLVPQNPLRTWRDSSLDGFINVTSDGHVQNIDLYGISLPGGTLPSTIGMLSALEYFDLAFTDISGTLPTSLGDLSSLQYFYVQYTSVVGSIPSSLGNLKSIIELYINHNSMTGTIPSQLGNLLTITALGLNEESLTGTIPSSLGRLSSLKVLFLDANSLSGNVPEELCQDPLDVFLLYSETTDFTGNELLTCFPSCLSSVTNIEKYDEGAYPIYYKYPFLNLTTCTPVPTSTPTAKPTEVPPIQAAICDLVLTTTLENQYNASCSSGRPSNPACSNSISTIEGVTCSGSNVTGLSFSSILGSTIPISITNLFGLLSLELTDSTFTSTIPSRLASMESLTNLDLSNDGFIGSISSVFGTMTNLISLDFSDNSLTGSIPSSLCSLSSLTSIDFSGNPSLTCYPSCLLTVSTHNFGSIPECTNSPTMAPTVAPLCLDFALIDVFGDGWGDSQLIVYTTRGQHTLFQAIPGQGVTVEKYCIPYGSYAADDIWIIKMIGYAPEYPWEMKWMVMNSLDSTTYTGGYDSTLTLVVTANSRNIATKFIVAGTGNLLEEITSCQSCISSSEGKLESPKRKPAQPELTTRTRYLTARDSNSNKKPKPSPPTFKQYHYLFGYDNSWYTSNSNDGSSFYYSEYFISEMDKQTLKYAGTLCSKEEEGTDEDCQIMLQSVPYIWRVTGILDKHRDDIGWSFCGAMGSYSTEVRFTIEKESGDCQVTSIRNLTEVIRHASDTDRDRDNKTTTITMAASTVTLRGELRLESPLESDLSDTDSQIFRTVLAMELNDLRPGGLAVTSEDITLTCSSVPVQSTVPLSESPPSTLPSATTTHTEVEQVLVFETTLPTSQLLPTNKYPIINNLTSQLSSHFDASLRSGLFMTRMSVVAKQYHNSKHTLKIKSIHILQYHITHPESINNNAILETVEDVPVVTMMVVLSSFSVFLLLGVIIIAIVIIYNNQRHSFSKSNEDNSLNSPTTTTTSNNNNTSSNDHSRLVLLPMEISKKTLHNNLLVDHERQNQISL